MFGSRATRERPLTVADDKADGVLCSPPTSFSPQCRWLELVFVTTSSNPNGIGPRIATLSRFYSFLCIILFLVLFCSSRFLSLSCLCVCVFASVYYLNSVLFKPPVIVLNWKCQGRPFLDEPRDHCFLHFHVHLPSSSSLSLFLLLVARSFFFVFLSPPLSLRLTLL